MCRSRCSLVFLLTLCLCCNGCGGGSHLNPQTIEGNWNIAGIRGTSSSSVTYSDYLSLAIMVSGNTVYGSGDIGINCPNNGFSVGGSLLVSGLMKSDGTFILTNGSVADSIQVKIDGKVPPRGATSWSGKLSLTMASCPLESTQVFVATPLPVLSGTYAGIIGGLMKAPDAQVSMQVAQGDLSVLQTKLFTIDRKSVV